MSRFSRRYDPNRHIEEWDWIREQCEGYSLSFNQNLSAEERKRRRDTYHEPFHAEIDACLSERLARWRCASAQHPLVHPVMVM